MENYPERMTVARANAADTVPKLDPVHTSAALHRTLIDGEKDRIAMLKRHHDWP